MTDPSHDIVETGARQGLPAAALRPYGRDKAKIEVAADKVSANTEFVINRQDFGVVYPGKADDLVQDNVALKISFVAPR